MAYVMGNLQVSNASTVPLFTVPAGLCNVTFWNSSTAASNIVYVGTSTVTTSANGLQCHSIPTSFSNYVSSKGATFYGANTSGTTGIVNFIIVTDQA
jgi:hypothetical protein